MIVYVVCFQYLQGWKKIDPDEILDININPFIGIWKEKSVGLVHSINFNLKYLYDCKVNNNQFCDPNEIPQYLNAQYSYPIEELEKQYNSIIEEINLQRNHENKYLEKYTIVREFNVS